MSKNVKMLLIIVGVLVVAAVSILLLTSQETDEVEPEERMEETKKEEKKELKEIVEGFLGTPYERDPLGEKDDEELYREDVFDCTTLVLVSVSELHSNGLSPEEMIKRINYFPAEEVSYENRLHFSTYRNKVLDFFEDITKEVAPDLYKEEEVTLNKERDEEGRLIDIDWEEEIIISYLETEDVSQVIPKLPDEVGVAFLMNGDEEIGLDIRHEGFLFEGKDFIHASLNKGEVSKEDFLEFLEESDYDGVNFFKVDY